ncbi:hypothetical protein HT576_09020 [Haloterrigena sp. SYSU A121-1]|uniref:Uncharacterized protein n=1 Tax=Haloterrigena gelatinilytica TaxID=2741724 RepID=A0A8J8GK67_9EURY|nr:hypothetical protein [Haloterrigena gelatinilytica]NUB91161.1 hypothetical protein [Haloterrigena gelatinilytica]
MTEHTVEMTVQLTMDAETEEEAMGEAKKCYKGWRHVIRDSIDIELIEAGTIGFREKSGQGDYN